MLSRRDGEGLPALAALWRLPCLSGEEEELSASAPEIQAACPGLVEILFLFMAESWRLVGFCFAKIQAGLKFSNPKKQPSTPVRKKEHGSRTVESRAGKPVVGDEDAFAAAGRSRCKGGTAGPALATDSQGVHPLRLARALALVSNFSTSLNTCAVVEPI